VYKFIIILLCLLYIPSNTAASGAFPIDNENTSLIGKSSTLILKNDETLIELARAYDTGYNEIVDANKNIDPWIPGKGTRVVLPTSWLLPDLIDEGILINLAELRIYYFFSVQDSRYVKTYPIGIGRQGFNTPTGIFKISYMTKDPVWKVPEASRIAHPELPLYVHPGPDNPLGGFWMQLSIDTYGIHGTNRPYGIGRRVSQGCIRLYPEDIKDLYTHVTPGTVVKIIDESIKVGINMEHVYIEVHRTDQSDSEIIELVTKKLSRKRLLKNVDTSLLIQSIKSATGLPALISK
jgi:L,D-transpeptidase ErfK/SrfK